MADGPWRLLFTRLFDFQATLSGDDLPLYVERPGSPAREIARQLDEDRGRANRFFLAGSPGSGKSSELAELGRRLDQEYAVIGLDVYASAANVTGVSGAEVLFMMGAAATRLASERWGVEISPSARTALFEAFKGVAHEPARLDMDRLLKGTALLTTVAANALGAPGALVKQVADGVVEGVMSRAPRSVVLRPYGGLARELREGDPELDRLAEALAEILRQVAEVRPPLILVDGLDRIEDPGSIRQLFLQTRLLDLPTCPVVYNGPIALWYGPEAMTLAGTARFQICPMPNITVEEPVPGSARLEPGALEEGRATLRRVVSRRLEAARLRVEDLLEPEALELMLTGSGGVLRDLIRLMHRAARLAHRTTPTPKRISVALAQRAFEESAAEVQTFAANLRRIEELRIVETQGRPSGSPESLGLLLHGAVLAYRDHVPWFRAHPFLRALLAQA